MTGIAPIETCSEPRGHEAWALWVVSYLGQSENAQVVAELRDALVGAAREYELPPNATEMFARLGGDPSDVVTPF